MALCCGCGLRKGSLIIAILSMVYWGFMLSIAIWGLKRFSGMDEAESVMIFLVCLSAFSLFFAALLLIGVLEKIPALLKTWVIFEGVYVSVILAAITRAIAYGNSRSQMAGQMIHILVSIYFIFVVKRYYQEVVSERAGNLQHGSTLEPAVAYTDTSPAIPVSQPNSKINVGQSMEHVGQ